MVGTDGRFRIASVTNWSRTGYTQEEYLALALGQGPVFEPGTDWGYSST